MGIMIYTNHDNDSDAYVYIEIASVWNVLEKWSKIWANRINNVFKAKIKKIKAASVSK